MHMYSNLSTIECCRFLVNFVTNFARKNLRSFEDKLGFKNQCLETKNILWAPAGVTQSRIAGS